MNVSIRRGVADLHTTQVAELVMTAPPITADMPCAKVFALLVQHAALPCLAVLDGDGTIVGMISRASYMAIMAKPLMGDLYAKRPVDSVMRADPLVLDVADTVEAAVGRLVQVNPDAMIEGFLVTRAGRYAGVGTAQDLLAKSADNAQRAALAIRAKSDRIAALLDHSGQGFLSFGIDMLVDHECSRACLDIFGRDPALGDIAHLLFPDADDTQALFRRAVAKALGETDDMRREMVLSLLPSRVGLAAKVLDVEYVVMAQARMMLIVSDVTAKVALEQTVERERRKQDLIVSAVVEGRELFATLNEFRAFLAGEVKVSDIDTLYREVHTFKGSFGQFNCFNLAQSLHQAEERIVAWRKLVETGKGDVAEPRAILAGTGLDQALAADLEVLAAVFGADFVADGGALMVPTGLGRRLRGAAASLLARTELAMDDDTRAGLNALAELGKVSLRQILDGYGALVARLADRLEKDVLPLAVEGDDVTLDPDRYGPFLRSLGHVFRNAVSHGLETLEEREEAGKDDIGGITCRIHRDGGGLRLDIADDGRGLDLVRLAEKAAQYLGAERARQLTRDQLMDLIFLDTLSTRTQADDISGRGVGLAAVRAAAIALGGQVAVSSVDGQGTCFHFHLPLS